MAAMGPGNVAKAPRRTGVHSGAAQERRPWSSRHWPDTTTGRVQWDDGVAPAPPAATGAVERMNGGAPNGKGRLAVRVSVEARDPLGSGRSQLPPRMPLHPGCGAHSDTPSDTWLREC